MGSETEIWLADDGPKACFRVSGKGDFRCSDDLRSAIRRLRESGCGEFTFDLAECPHMDSTFVGVIASPLRKLPGAKSAAPRCKVRICRAPDSIRQILDDMGLAPLVEFVGNTDAESCFEPTEHGPGAKEDLSKTSLEAHETLIELDPSRNKTRFQNVVTYLRQELEADKGEDGD